MFFQPLFAFDQTFLAAAGLSNESVKYYASLVQFYSVYNLQRMAVSTSRLSLLCFATHCFRQLNDNLIESFIHLVDDYEQQAKLATEIAAAEAMAEATGSLQAAGQVLNLFLDPAIPDSTPFLKVRQRAFSLLDADRSGQVSEYMRKIEFGKAAFEWSFYGTLHAKFKLNLRICSRISTSPVWSRTRRCSKRWPSCRRSCVTANRLARSTLPSSRRASSQRTFNAICTPRRRCGRPPT